MRRILLSFCVLTLADCALAQSPIEEAVRSVEVHVQDLHLMRPTVVMLDLSVLNRSKFWLRNIHIQCEFLRNKIVIKKDYNIAKGEVEPGKALLKSLLFIVPNGTDDARCSSMRAEAGSPL